jgi:uncharacterized protein YndB with AHSA1/START domain
MARQIQKAIQINCTIEDLFDALITPSAIKKWWNASHAIVIPAVNGIYTVSWGSNIDSPDYVSSAEILEFQPPSFLRLGNYRYATKGELEAVNPETITEFIIKNESGKTTLKVTQSGFPDDRSAVDFYAACTKGWEDTLHSIQQVMEA